MPRRSKQPAVQIYICLPWCRADCPLNSCIRLPVLVAEMPKIDSLSLDKTTEVSALHDTTAST